MWKRVSRTSPPGAHFFPVTRSSVERGELCKRNPGAIRALLGLVGPEVRKDRNRGFLRARPSGRLACQERSRNVTTHKMGSDQAQRDLRLKSKRKERKDGLSGAHRAGRSAAKNTSRFTGNRALWWRSGNQGHISDDLQSKWSKVCGHQCKCGTTNLTRLAIMRLTGGNVFFRCARMVVSAVTLMTKHARDEVAGHRIGMMLMV